MASSSSSPSCIVCRDYSAIDKFANDFSLSKISIMSDFKALDQLRDAKTSMDKLLVISKSLEDQVQLSAQAMDVLKKEMNDLNKKIQSAQAECERLSKGKPPNTAAIKAANDALNTLMSEHAAKDLAFFEFFERQGTGSVELSKQIDDLVQLTTQKSQEIATVLFKKCRQEGIIASDTDYIGRARLFYAWIALSIEFNPAADDPKQWANRTPAQTLLSEVEVCIGFANLFAMMFNAIPKTNNEPAGFNAVAIIGWNKSSNRASPKKSPPDIKHAWNAFPYLDSAGAPQMKLIDTTWARKSTLGAVDVMLDSQWFTMTNKAFLARHYPDDPSQQFVPVADQITLDAFWPQDLPTFDTKKLASALISQASLVPTSYILANQPNTRFSFSPACAHVLGKLGANVPAFALLVGSYPPQSDDDWARIITFRFDSATSTWTTSADLSAFKPDGSAKVTLAVAIRDGLWVQLAEGSEARDLQAVKAEVTWEGLAQWQVGAPPKGLMGVFIQIGNVFNFDKKGKKPVPN